MARFHRSRLTGLGLVVALLLVQLWSCTQDKGSITQPQIPAYLYLTSPVMDTTVATNEVSITAKGKIINLDKVAITSLKVNGKDATVTDSLFSCVVTLAAGDTTLIIAQLVSMGNTSADSVKAIRQSVVSKNGNAKLTGTLLRESSGSLAKRLSHSILARNAAGTATKVQSVVPVTGADVMFYASGSMKSSSDTSVKTDSLGGWSIELPPGDYFVFAVYFDRENLQIVTSSLPNVAAVADKETKTDTATAASDDVKPMLMTFCDAVKPDSSGLFLAADLVQKLPIVMTFSEPMNRISAGDGITGIVLGRTNPDSADLQLLDTIPVTKLWSPSGTELRLVPKTTLESGKTYKVLIPSSVKDLALNKLSSTLSGVFRVTAISDLPPFAIMSTTPVSGDTMVPLGFPIEITFTRSVDAISLNKNYTLACIDPAAPVVRGFFDAKGGSAKFVATTPWTQGKSYTMSIKGGALDLLGDSLGAGATATTFRIKPPDAFQNLGGDKAIISEWMQKIMAAYIAGDVATFSQAFHPQMEAVELNPNPSGTIDTIRMLRDKFIEARRADIADQEELSKLGIIAPVWYYINKNGMWHSCWKLTKGTTSLYLEDMGSGSFGKIPAVFKMDSTQINDSIRFFDRGIVYKGDSLLSMVNMNTALVNQNTRTNDPRVFGRLLREQTNVQTQEVFLDITQSFAIKDISVTLPGKEAMVMQEVISEQRYRDNKRPYPIIPGTIHPDVEKNVMAVQMKMVNESGKWLVIQVFSKNLFSGDKNTFAADSIKTDAFAIQNVSATGGIELLSPAQKAVNVASPVVLRWKRPAGKTGGFLVAISNQMSGCNAGLLMYTRDTMVTINADGSVTGATVLNIDPKQLNVPLPQFSARLSSISAKDSAVYQWKVVGIADTLASSIVAGVMLNIMADSDFGPTRGMGIFTLLAVMPNITMQPINQPMQGPAENMFSDRDGDFFPDWIEKAFWTSPDDPTSYPNYVMDSDLDGSPDFMEEKCGTSATDATSKPVDTNPADGIPDLYQINRPEWRTELTRDDDKDGFPNEIEIIYGSSPNDPASKPSKMIRPSIPTGKYFGVVEIPAPNAPIVKKIIFTISADSSVVIDTAALEELTRFGYPLPNKMVFMAGEWVFFAPIGSGPNTGKFLKFRLRSQPPMINGNVDMADMINGGGPLVGNIRATSDSTVDMTKPSTQPPPNTNPGQPTNYTLNFGPPAPEKLKRAATASDLNLSLIADTLNGSASVIVVINGRDTLRSAKSFWQPGQWPAIRFASDAPVNGRKISFDGNLHKQGDSLILTGPMWIDSGTVRRNLDFTVILRGVANPRTPQGTWIGWYTETSAPAMPTNNGPLPYIGDESGIKAALALAGNKGKTGKDSTMMDTTVLTILSYARPGTGPWTAKCSDGKEYMFLEKTAGNMAEIRTIPVNGVTYVVLIQGGGTQPPAQPPVQPPQNLLIYRGDSLSIVNALSAAQNKVFVNIPNGAGYTSMVTPSSLKSKQDSSGLIWMVSDYNNPAKMYLLMGDNTQPQKVVRDGAGNVMVGEMGGTTQPPVQPPTQPKMMVYKGDSLSIVTALTAANSKVFVNVPNGAGYVASVSLPSLKSKQDSMGMIWIVSDYSNQAKTYIVMGDSSKPQKVVRDAAGNVMVGEMGGTTQPPVNPPPPAQNMMIYRGDSLSIVSALGSANKVFVNVPNGAGYLANIVPNSLKARRDTTGTTWLVTDIANPAKSYIIMGDNGQPQKVAKDGAGNVLASEGGTTQPPVQPPVQSGGKAVPYAGDSATAAAAFPTNISTQVMVFAPPPATQPISASVSGGTLRSEPNGKGGTIWTIADYNNLAKRYIIMADSTTPKAVLKDAQNKPMLSEMTTPNPPFTGDSMTAIIAVGNAAGKVYLMDNSQPSGVTVDRATIHWIADPKNAAQKLLVATNPADAAKPFVFLGGANPAMLIMKDNMPMVMIFMP